MMTPRAGDGAAAREACRTLVCAVKALKAPPFELAVFSEDCHCGSCTTYRRVATALAAARAEERKRCAALAQAVHDTQHTLGHSGTCDAEVIAAAIEEG